MPERSGLLSEPFLQLPDHDSVRVVWFTAYPGTRHTVTYGAELDYSVDAQTFKLTRMAEDADTFVGTQAGDGTLYGGWTPRDVWRHEAHITELQPGIRVPYFVTSTDVQGRDYRSNTFTLAPVPAPGQPLRILLTADHQLKPMVPANLQKVEETVGRVDAVLMAGDLVNHADCASEWFDDTRARAFFPCMQGRSEGTYRGGAIIQHAPLFSCIGNHEIMGRFNPQHAINTQFDDAVPLAVATQRYEQLADLVNPSDDPLIRQQWIKDNSYNATSYQELFSLPGDKPYYAVSFGDMYVIVLFAARMWRTSNMVEGVRGRFQEAAEDFNLPDNWGHGEFIFEDLRAGSAQYEWLVKQLNSDSFRRARFRVVMMHHPIHSTGRHAIPVFTEPQRQVEYDNDDRISGIYYTYPFESDILHNDILPLLNEAGVQLVFNGHSHLWNRFRNEHGVNFLESSNVGNTYGSYSTGYRERENAPTGSRFNPSDYVQTGNPHNLMPIPPSIFAPQHDDAGNALPTVSSNDLTVFSILDTETGTVRSYLFDVNQPDSDARLFDEFNLDAD